MQRGVKFPGGTVTNVYGSTLLAFFNFISQLCLGDEKLCLRRVPSLGVSIITCSLSVLRTFSRSDKSRIRPAREQGDDKLRKPRENRDGFNREPFRENRDNGPPRRREERTDR